MLLLAQRSQKSRAMLAARHVALLLTFLTSAATSTPGATSTIVSTTQTITTTPAPVGVQASICESKTLRAYYRDEPSLNLSNQTLSIHGESRVRLTAESQAATLQCIDNPKNVPAADLQAASVDLLYEHAREFCKDGDITILAGANYFDLGLKDALDVCLQPIPTTSKKLEEFCLKDDSLCQLELATADSVQTTTFLKFAFLAQFTDVQDAVMQAREKATDDAVRSQIEADPEESEEVIIRIFRSIILGQEGRSKSLLQESIKRLEVSFINLNRVFDLQSGSFEKSLEECNRMVLRTDEDKVILVDLCRPDGRKCIEEAVSGETGHVSSCCVYNPQAAMKEFHDANTEQSNCSFNHVCSASRKGIEVDLAREEMRDRTDSKVYGRHVKNLETEHGAHYKETEYFRGYGEDSAAAPLMEVSNYDACPNIQLGGLPESTLPESLRSNISANGGYRNLEVVYDLEGDIGNVQNRCDKRFSSSMANLFGRCQAFCGASAIPIIAGTLTTGLDLKAALGACFALANGTAEDEHFCQARGPMALTRLQESMAEFTSNITVFKSGKLRWTARMKDNMDDIVNRTAKFIDEELNPIANTEKVPKIIEFYEAEFAKLTDDQLELIALGDGVLVSFQRLRQVYNETFDDVMAYAEKCASSNFPRTEYKQSVLAMCNHGQSYCADHDEASYTFCCCGNNPMLENRDSDVDICSRSKQLAAEPYTNTMAPLLGGTPRNPRRSGRLAGAEPEKLKSGKEYFERFEAGMTTKYGASYDPPLSTDDLYYALGLCSGTCLATETCKDLSCVPCQDLPCSLGFKRSFCGHGSNSPCYQECSEDNQCTVGNRCDPNGGYCNNCQAVNPDLNEACECPADSEDKGLRCANDTVQPINVSTPPDTTPPTKSSVSREQPFCMIFLLLFSLLCLACQ